MHEPSMREPADRPTEFWDTVGGTVTARVEPVIGQGEKQRSPVIDYLRDLEAVARRQCSSRDNGPDHRLGAAAARRPQRDRPLGRSLRADLSIQCGVGYRTALPRFSCERSHRIAPATAQAAQVGATHC
jgi:hypothetical protein